MLVHVKYIVCMYKGPLIETYKKGGIQMPITPPDGFLEGLLCQVGVLLLFILLTLAIIVAQLFGIDASLIDAARDALSDACAV
jgi:hypothetical protein